MSAVTIESKLSDYDALLIPMRRIAADNYAAIMDSLPTDANNAAVVAFRATLQTLNGLWHLPDAEWRKVRDNVNIGIVKETKSYGNASVSMGCATRYFAGNPTRSGVVFLNCGANGIKYQYYRKENNIIFVAHEYEPKDGASPNAITARGYTFERPVEYIHNASLLNNELFDFSNEVSIKFANVQDTYSSITEGPSSVETFAFITGSIRESWGRSMNRDSLETVMRDYFYSTTPGSAGVIINSFSDSFFLSPSLEEELEFLGTSKMYENLESVGLINRGSTVISSFGIGLDMQNVWKDPRDISQTVTIDYKAGMDRPDVLAKLPYFVIPKLNNALHLIIEYASHCAIPVIALQSGCMLYLESLDGATTRYQSMVRQMD